MRGSAGAFVMTRKSAAWASQQRPLPLRRGGVSKSGRWQGREMMRDVEGGEGKGQTSGLS